MAYKEYKAKPGKVLFNIDTFTWGNQIMTRLENEFNLIEMDKETAEYYSTTFTESEQNLRDNFRAQNKNIENTNEGVMTLDENGVYSETENTEVNIDTQIEDLKSKLLKDILSKGYSINSNIEVIQH